MKNKKLLLTFLFVISFFLPSCKSNLLEPEQKLWGYWKLVSPNQGTNSVAYDLNILEDGTLIVINNPSLQNTPLKFSIISNGIIKITGMEQPLVVNYDVNDEILRIFIKQDSYIYQKSIIDIASTESSVLETTPPVIEETIVRTPEVTPTEPETPAVIETEIQPSAYFLSLPTPVKTYEKSNSTWQMFGSPSSARDMMEYNGVIWTAGYGGLTAWDKLTGQYKHYTRFDGLPSNEVLSIIFSEEDDTLWVGFHEGGIAKFTGKEWIPIESQGLEDIIGVTNDGSIWALGRYGDLIGRYKNGIWEVYNSWNGFVEGADEIISQIVGYNGDLWVKTTNINDEPIILLYHDGYWRTFNNNLPDPSFSLLAPASDTEVWLLASNELVLYDGAKTSRVAIIPSSHSVNPYAISSVAGYTLAFSTYEYDKFQNGYSGLIFVENKKLQALTIDKGLPSNNISSTCFDTEGNLWISTKEGIASFNGENWTSFSGENAPSLGFEITAIKVLNDNTIWISSHKGGLSVLQDNTWSSYHFGEGPSSDYLYGLFIENDASVWVGTWISGEVNHYNKGRWEIFDNSDGLEEVSYIWEIDQSSDGKIWAGTNQGVAVFDGTLWETTIVNRDKAFADIRSVACSPNGEVWIGSYDSQNGGKIAKMTDGKWTVYDKYKGLTAGDHVFAIEISPTGIVYAGTENGLFRLANDRWESLGGPKYINDIAFEGNGSVWVATEFSGINHYKGGQWIENYTLAEGLPSYRTHAIEVAPDGSIWVGGGGGLVKIVPKK